MPAPGPDTEIHGEPSSRGTLTAPDGASIGWSRWDRDAARGRVVILHGYGEHGERYAHIAGWLGGLGWSVAAMDQRGFGRSSGIRGDSQGLATFVEDFRRFLLAERLPGRPLVVLAHSFGALVALATLGSNPGLVEGAVLSSPSIALRPFPRSIRWIQAILLRVAPHLALDLPNNKDLVCSDPAMVERYWADPLCHRRVTAAYSEVFAEGHGFLLGCAAGFATPLLVLEAGQDTVADPDGTEDFWSRLPPGVAERRRLPGFRHEIFHDLHRRAAQDLAAGWLQRLFPAAAGTLAPVKPCEDERG